MIQFGKNDFWYDVNTMKLCDFWFDNNHQRCHIDYHTELVDKDSMEMGCLVPMIDSWEGRVMCEHSILSHIVYLEWCSSCQWTVVCTNTQIDVDHWLIDGIVRWEDMLYWPITAKCNTLAKRMISPLFSSDRFRFKWNKVVNKWCLIESREMSATCWQSMNLCIIHLNRKDR